jgi:hypothetical protein
MGLLTCLDVHVVKCRAVPAGSECPCKRVCSEIVPLCLEPFINGSFEWVNCLPILHLDGATADSPVDSRKTLNQMGKDPDQSWRFHHLTQASRPFGFLRTEGSSIAPVSLSATVSCPAYKTGALRRY